MLVKMGMLYLLISLFLAAGVAPGAHAQAVSSPAAEQTYFEALYDVPVMPGLQEVKEAAMVFDKPDGRIAAAMAASSTVSIEAVTRFYADVLPQMGWMKNNKNQYVRDGKVLAINVGKEKGLTTVHFSLSPAVR